MTTPALPSAMMSNDAPTLNSLEHKLRGTLELSLSNLPLALHHYTLALLLSSPTPSLLIPLHLNLAFTHLRIGTSPRLALSSALKALDLGAEGAQREKAVFRAAQAYYSLELWDKAGEMLERMEKGGREREEWLVKVERRKKERDGAEFDWCGMMVGGVGGDGKVADFVGPVKVVEMKEGKGRGLIAARDIEEGELVMCVKPFASVLEEELDSNEKIQKEGAINPVTDLIDSITQVKLASKVLDTVKVDPLSASALHLLYAGPSLDSPPPFPLSALLPNPEPNPNDGPAPLTIHQVSLSIAYNSFTPRPLPSTALLPPSTRTHPPSALYVLPSLLNHSCLPNTSWTFYSPSSGLPLAIRARKPIKKGEEITQSYCSGLDFDVRRVLLEKHLPEESRRGGCGCALCMREHADGVDGRERRKALLGVLKGEMMGREPGEGGVRSLENLAEALKKTYESRIQEREGEVRLEPDMWEVYHQLSDQLSYLAFHPSSTNRPSSDASGRTTDLARRSIEAEINALRSCGVTFVGLLPTTGLTTSSSSSKPSPISSTLPQPPFLNLPVAREEACVGSCFVVASVWEMLGEEKLARRWVEEGRRVERVLVGSDGKKEKVWKKRWSGIGREYGVERYM